jgi:hypothetical protein
MANARELPGSLIRAERGDPNRLRPREFCTDQKGRLWYCYNEQPVCLWPLQVRGGGGSAPSSGTVINPPASYKDLPLQAFWTGALAISNAALLWRANKADFLTKIEATLKDASSVNAVELDFWVSHPNSSPPAVNYIGAIDIPVGEVYGELIELAIQFAEGDLLWCEIAVTGADIDGTGGASGLHTVWR